MKRAIPCFLLLLFLSLHSFSQECISFDEVHAMDSLSISRLESEYGFQNDGKEGGVMREVHIPVSDSAYRGFVKRVGQFLADHEGVVWDATIRYFQRIYFEPDGTVAYYIYEFKENGFQGPSRDRFENAVERFLSKNSLDVENEERFVACAPVVLRPPQD